MTHTSPAACSCLAAALFSSLTILPGSVEAAPARRPAPAAGKTGPSAPAPKPIVPDNTIIPLPLNPIVPAAQRLCAARTASGLGYTMLRPGAESKPTADATVLVNYLGFLAATGAVFDQAMQSPLPIDGVIPGFSEALQMVGKGGVARFCIPAALGYGATESGPIPANSDLVFQVEVLDFRSAAELQSMRGEAAATPPPR